jgi:DNA-binding MarR family transcriptional regulator
MSNATAEHATAESVVNAVLAASRVLVAVAARSLADTAEEVTLTQYRTLVMLASRGPQSLAGLADAVAVTPATASRMCDRLVGKGLVRRRTERGNRRQIRVALTAEGRHLVDAVTARRRCEIERIISSMPSNEQTVLVQALDRLAAVAGEVPERDWTTGWDL